MIHDDNSDFDNDVDFSLINWNSTVIFSQQIQRKDGRHSRRTRHYSHERYHD